MAAAYARHRQVHPGVLAALHRRGSVTASSIILEVGCGTGNYIGALQADTGCEAWGVDPAPYRDRVFSSLRLIPEDAFQRGLARLEADLKKGPIPCVSRYVLLWGTRPT